MRKLKLKFIDLCRVKLISKLQMAMTTGRISKSFRFEISRTLVLFIYFIYKPNISFTYLFISRTLVLFIYLFISRTLVLFIYFISLIYFQIEQLEQKELKRENMVIYLLRLNGRAFF